ncbi:DUF2786 domain-containing protein [Fluviispira multicolorata]|uniref:DUF2786 domain-containing protein n=1 Tax=Fluviispira multicolorata TaxID=2654512 RepID=A0A833JHG6_9BACT|nr:DUF2786 domain-containing protein [Fluviispira multicolorata]KAB8033392.1 DUF2786 domain-containing protein [Fluviispira multicolorata]
MKFQKIKNDLRTRWTLQLYKEYGNICYQYGVYLKKPLILIEDLKNTWGNWNSHSKIITLSILLIEEYPWDVVIGVLKHEIAHQIVTDIFCSNDKHGSDFQRACEMIGVSKEFCKCTLDIENKILHFRNEKNCNEDENVLRKLEKLLNLAQSANENEALLAMEKVQDLYSKYNVKRIQEGQKSEYYSLVVNFNKKKAPSTYVYIASLLQQHYFVNVIFSDLYDPLADESFKTLEILGTRHNVLMAEYVFYFLIERIESLWKNYQKEKNVTGRHKMSYQKGLLVGFQDKLNLLQKDKLKKKKENNIDQENITSLILLEDKKLQDFTKKMFPRIVKKDSSTNKVFTEHYDKGKKEGEKIILNKAVTTHVKEKRFLSS